MARAPGPNDVGLRLVILYKTVKGALWLVLALILGVGAQLGLASTMQDLINTIHNNATHTWSIRLTEFLFTEITRQHLDLAAIGLTLDGSLTALEGWALHTRKPWGEWLVVVLTGSFIPVELESVVHHLLRLHHISVARIGILVVNVWIVAYLARRIVHERAARRREASEIKSESPANP